MVSFWGLLLAHYDVRYHFYYSLSHLLTFFISYAFILYLLTFNIFYFFIFSSFLVRELLGWLLKSLTNYVICPKYFIFLNLNFCFRNLYIWSFFIIPCSFILHNVPLIFCIFIMLIWNSLSIWDYLFYLMIYLF